MKLKLRNPIKNRTFISNLISCVIQGNKHNGIPYMVNNSDDCWTLDNGNDWHLRFDDEDDTKLRISYRYNSETNDKESFLASWLCFKLDAVLEK